MSEMPYEQFAGNRSINDQINEILNGFTEPSRSRMRKEIRNAAKALHKHGTTQTEEQAFHKFREFLIGSQLNRNGFALEYSKSIGGQTPDWFDESANLVMDVFTIDSSGTADPTKRAVDSVAGKVSKYHKMINANSHHFVVGIHGAWGRTFDGDGIHCAWGNETFDQVDCEDVAVSGRLFGQAPELSGVIFFEATKVAFKRLADGTLKKKQVYAYTYFPNPNAARTIDLTEACRACLPFG
jgi:hypothetical protein